jgi:hypothetical protein
MDKKLIIPFIPIIIGTLAGLIIALYPETGGEVGMTNGSAIAIVVALISVAGTLLGLLLQFKKDSNRIGEVKSDTSEIKPKVDNISVYTKETNDLLSRTIAPEVGKLGTLQTDVSAILEDVNYKKRVQAEYKGSLNRDAIVTGIETIYADNASFRDQVKEQGERIKKLTLLNNSLEKTNQSLKAEIERLEKQQARGQDWETPRGIMQDGKENLRDKYSAEEGEENDLDDGLER